MGAGVRLRRKQRRVGDFDRDHVARRDDHAHADPRLLEQALGEAVGHADATMRRRMSREGAAVQSDARPGDALHAGHGGIVVEVRVMLRLLLEDAEDAGGCLASLLAARHWRAENPAVGVEDRDLLALQRHDRHDRRAGGALRDRLDRALGMSAGGARGITRRDRRGETGRGNHGQSRGPPGRLSGLRVRETRGHTRPLQVGTQVCTGGVIT
jgi:hypothetical protein